MEDFLQNEILKDLDLDEAALNASKRTQILEFTNKRVQITYSLN